MSAFSRGLGLAMNQRIFCFAPRTIPTTPITSLSQSMRNSPIIQAARNLSSTFAHHAKPKPKVKISNAIPKETSHTNKPAPTFKASKRAPRSRPLQSSTASSPQAARLVTARFAKLTEPLLIYESPSHFWYHFFSLLTFGFCMIYAGFHYYWYVWTKVEGLHWSVPWGWGLICLFMLGAGWFFLLGTSRMVRRIHVIPKQLVSQTDGKGLKVAHKMSLDESPVAIKITLSQISSLLPEKKVIAAPSEVWLAVKMQKLVRHQTVEKDAYAKKYRAPDPLRDTFMDKASDHINAVWMGAKRAFTRGGFLPIKANGQRYRLDVSRGARIMGDGKEIDALLPHHPDKFDARLTEKFLNT